MGSLEEAIREHLELQRRRGADPHSVERAEQEALQPLVPGQTPAWAEGPALFDQHESHLEVRAEAMDQQSASAASPDQLPDAPAAMPGSPAYEPLRAAGTGAYAEPAFVEQETAEFDMSTVLGEASTWNAPPAPGSGVPEFGPVRARRIVHERPTNMAEQNEFEWEIPERSPQPPQSESPAGRGSFAFE